MWRMMLNIQKNPAVIWLRFAMYFALSILIATVWLDVGDDEDAILNIINVIFFISAFMVFMSVLSLSLFISLSSSTLLMMGVPSTHYRKCSFK